MRSRGLALALLLLAACSRSPKIETIAAGDWDQVIAGHRGSVAVVLVWATWCRSCEDLLPAFAALERRLRADEIRFLTVALDDHDNPGAIAQASEMLSRHEASFPHYVFASEISGSLATLGIKNVPAVLVYDAEGAPRHRLETGVFDNDLSVADIEDAIESLRSPPAPE